MQISELARRTGVSVHALRHYERQGLIRPRRLANGYREYPEGLRREVVFIAMSRRLGFALPDIARRLGDYRAGTLRIDDMVQALQQRVQALDKDIARLQAQKATVLEHQAWLRRQAAPAPAPRRADPAKAPAPWPRVRGRGPGAAPHRTTPPPPPRSLP
ncbi:MerR family DNA-binding transcriptional regulator [Paracidovorax sp. MALMAid1276]|uniref:MerR family DNA-binding transcriptional regulator n=1 Tax=Paracidovorax sp. MALMAid1276 TaxID=3411631 RepID=UPI003B9BE30D